MKVPDNLIYSLFIQQDNSIRRKISDRTLDISTGRKLRNLSDEPASTVEILNLKKDIYQLSQYSQNRLFVDTSLSFIEFNLGQVEDVLRVLYQKAIQAKSSLISKDQLSSIAQEFEKSLSFILDRANEKLGQNYIFGGADLTKKPFDTVTLNYNASNTPFEVWISENTKVETILNGGKVFSSNVYVSIATFPAPITPFLNPGSIYVTVGSTSISVNYGGLGEPSNLQELADHINQNYSNLLKALVSQNPNGTYSLVIATNRAVDNLIVSATGEFSSGFDNPNILQWTKRIKDKLANGLHTDESDLFVIQRSYDLIAIKRSDVGSVLSNVKSAQPTQENLNDILRKRKSDIEDVDLPQSINEYTRYRLAYEALMRIVANQRDVTILRYI